MVHPNFAPFWSDNQCIVVTIRVAGREDVPWYIPTGREKAGGIGVASLIYLGHDRIIPGEDTYSALYILQKSKAIPRLAGQSGGLMNIVSGRLL